MRFRADHVVAFLCTSNYFKHCCDFSLRILLSTISLIYIVLFDHALDESLQNLYKLLWMKHKSKSSQNATIFALISFNFPPSSANRDARVFVSIQGERLENRSIE